MGDCCLRLSSQGFEAAEATGEGEGVQSFQLPERRTNPGQGSFQDWACVMLREGGGQPWELQHQQSKGRQEKQVDGGEDTVRGTKGKTIWGPRLESPGFSSVTAESFVKSSTFSGGQQKPVIKEYPQMWPSYSEECCIQQQQAEKSNWKKIIEGEGGSWDPGVWASFCELQFQIC